MDCVEFVPSDKYKELISISESRKKELGVDFRRISNIVRTIKEKFKDCDPDFKNFRFYLEFGEDYEYTFMNSREKFETYVDHASRNNLGKYISLQSDNKHIVVRIKNSDKKLKDFIKSFSIKKYGFDSALSKAIEIRDIMVDCTDKHQDY